jgi:hypothetical protein
MCHVDLLEHVSLCYKDGLTFDQTDPQQDNMYGCTYPLRVSFPSNPNLNLNCMGLFEL